MCLSTYHRHLGLHAALQKSLSDPWTPLPFRHGAYPYVSPADAVTKVLQVLIYLWEALLPYMAARRQYSLPVRAEEADREQGRLLVISGRVDEACRAAIKGE